MAFLKKSQNPDIIAMSGSCYAKNLCRSRFTEASRSKEIIEQLACCFAHKKKSVILCRVFLFVNADFGKSIVKLLLCGFLLALDNYRRIKDCLGICKCS